ncbi:hypothetical protein [Pararhizobium sp. A13]
MTSWFMPISFVGVSPSSWLDGSGKSRAPDRSLKMDKTAFYAAAFPALPA